VSMSARRVAIVALLSACARDVSVVEVRDLGLMEAPPEMLGRDGGVSGAFFGRSVWVYGDGVAAQAGSYPNTWRNNSMSWTSDLDASDGLSGLVQPVDGLGAAKEFFPRTPEEQAFNEAHLDDGDCEAACGARKAVWGGAPVEDGDRAWLSYAVIHAEPGEWNFYPEGQSLAVWSRDAFDAGPERPPAIGARAPAELLFDSAAEGEFGPGLYVEGGQLGMYSCSGGPWQDHRCRLGRAPVERALERDAWRFWDGRGWSAEVTDARALFEGSPNISVRYNAFLDRWLAVYIDWGVIRLRTAPAPEGPWSGEVDVHRPPEEGAMHAAEHAELQQEDGRIVALSYLTEEGFRLLEVTLQGR
jgi:hypothetical protein